MHLNSDHNDRVTEEAARWLGILLDGRDGHRELFAWLEESPRHVEEFLFVLADAQDLAALSPQQQARIDDLTQELGFAARESGSNVVPFSPTAVAESPEKLAADDVGAISVRHAAPRQRALFRWGAALAASLVIAAAAVWWVNGPGAWNTYTTNVGEQRVVSLADGSVVHLNTASTVSVRMTDSLRDVRLARGEALFSVEHDPGRPFLVRTPDAVIQAIGTRFDVYSRADRTQVAVIEGLVQVSNAAGDIVARARPAPLKRSAELTEFVAAGEAADVLRTGKVSHPHAIDPLNAVAWRQRRLVFEDDSLAEIAAEFNRYNAGVKIRVVGKAADQRFSGTFDADAPDAMKQALAGDPALRVERTGSEIVISAREPSEQ